MKVISYLWKRKTASISVTTAVVLIHTMGFSSELLSTFWDHENRIVPMPGSKHGSSRAVKNVTIQFGTQVRKCLQFE